MTAKCEIARCHGLIFAAWHRFGEIGEDGEKSGEFTVVQMWVERPTDPWSPISPNGCERCEPWVQRANGGDDGGEGAVDEIESVDAILRRYPATTQGGMFI